MDIEELRSLEFHTKVQGDESIEQLGIDIQKLGHKAFPTMKGKEFDHIIKGPASFKCFMSSGRGSWKLLSRLNLLAHCTTVSNA